ncbi:replication initiation protein [Psychrobacillus sp. FSL H8-0487]|uniref:replication initiation protein n=1 Tax=Psychrobacillus sp. FSL H8-0487 TaxID=2921391 RepID=UPI0030FCC617
MDVPFDFLVSKDNTVTKSNLLIEAAYKLSASEFKIIQTVFSNIQPGDISFHTYSFPVKQFLDLLDLKGNSGYSALKKMTEELYKKPITFTTDNVTTQITWFSKVQYNENKGTITLKVDEFWEQYLLSLSNNFTSYKLFNITNLRSIYSLRLYELLKSRVSLNSVRIISIEDLKAKMGIDPEQYPKYANFKQRVILQAQKELKAESDIYFEFTEIKKGRAVNKIEFHIYRNQNKSPVEPLILETVLKEQEYLMEFNLNPKVINNIIEKYSVEQITRNVIYTKEQIALGRVDSPPAYILKAIEKDFAISTSENPKKKDMQEEFLERLQEKNENVMKENYDRLPEEIEKHLLQVKELKESLGKDESGIKHEIYEQIMSYQLFQESTYDKLVSPKNFKDKYLQDICKEVLSNIYSYS